jgi:hypothetical protein
MSADSFLQNSKVGRYCNEVPVVGPGHPNRPAEPRREDADSCERQSVHMERSTRHAEKYSRILGLYDEM